MVCNCMNMYVNVFARQSLNFVELVNFLSVVVDSTVTQAKRYSFNHKMATRILPFINYNLVHQ